MSEESVDDLATAGRVEETVSPAQSVDDLATAVDPAGSADPAVGAIVEAIAAAEALPLGEQPARFHDLYGRLAAELEDQ